MTFIRAPYISSTQGAEILAEIGGKAKVMSGEYALVTAFHSELTEDTSVHSYFLDMAAARELRMYKLHKLQRVCLNRRTFSYFFSFSANNRNNS